MLIRKVKDAQDLGSGELIYFKSHAKATYMSDGRTVEDAINDMQEGGGNGEQGVGIESVVQTTTSMADGGDNVVTVTLSDGKTSTFTVKNGSKGSQGDKGADGKDGSNGTDGSDGITPQLKIENGYWHVSYDKGQTWTQLGKATGEDGKDGADGTKGEKGDKGEQGNPGTDGKDGTNGATFTPFVDADGNLSWTNDKGLTNPATVNIKGPKGDNGEGVGENIMSAPIDNISGEYLVNFYSTPMQPDVAYVAEIPINAIYNLDMVAPQTLSATYTLHFRTAGTIGIFVFPSNLLWANGEIPTIEPYVNYELSIVATKLADEYIYKAVLTPFKSI